jgi:hypothetical protein
MSAITYIVNGTIGADPPYETGIDGGGFFGPPGASIVGDHFWVTWTGTPCNCIGAAGNPLLEQSFPLPNPIIDVTLQIGTQPYDHNPVFDYGTGTYGEWYTNPPSAFSLQQTGFLTPGNVISTSFGFSVNPAGPNGAFSFGGTSGTFTDMAVGVPAPAMGSGLLGLLLMIGLLILSTRRLLMRHGPLALMHGLVQRLVEAPTRSHAALAHHLRSVWAR